MCQANRTQSANCPLEFSEDAKVPAAPEAFRNHADVCRRSVRLLAGLRTNISGALCWESMRIDVETVKIPSFRLRVLTVPRYIPSGGAMLVLSFCCCDSELHFPPNQRVLGRSRKKDNCSDIAPMWPWSGSTSPKRLFEKGSQTKGSQTKGHNQNPFVLANCSPLF